MQLVFMTYVARSGSTMLSHRLAERCPDVVVLPEFQLPDILLRAGDRAVRQMGPRALERVIRHDPQRETVGLDDERTARIACQAERQGIRFLLEEIVRQYADRCSPHAKTAIVKKGSLVFHQRTLRSLFPDSVLVHPFRDPRGAVNSLTRTRDPYSGKWMARGDALFAARYWRRFMTAIQKVKQQSDWPLVEVRYESLCNDPDAVVAGVAGELGLCCSAGGSHVPIAPAEQAMHALVTEGTQAARCDAWQRELQPWQGTVIEWIARRELLARNYELWYMTRFSAAAQKRHLLTAHLHSARNNVVHGVRAVVHDAHNMLKSRLRRPLPAGN